MKKAVLDDAHLEPVKETFTSVVKWNKVNDYSAESLGINAKKSYICSMKNEQKNLIGDKEADNVKAEAFTEPITRIATHHEQRQLVACIFGDPVNMVKGSMWYYSQGGEQYQLFMPFTEHPVQSAIYDYAGTDGKVRVRRRGQRMSITLDCPIRLGVAGIDDLFRREEVRQALAKAEGSDELQQNANAA